MGCYRPSKNAIIAEELQKAEKELEMDFGVKDFKKLPKEWMLHVLANLANDNEFFGPGFYPEKAKKKFQIGDVDYEFRYKQEKLNAAAKEKIEKLQELMKNMTCDETRDTTTNSIAEGTGEFVI